ncbi:hypothetical protein CH63R_07486 [Colletotrichum higginsianum IMI 349063]|uniref:Uncharacterized protein n=1 Tax=Colletotrichum higginsianum (strain IMI 349063) TaxID=759273 RepID=A0A1B7Y9F6_COLHI|nr:hypothetical protein CH63R_07486 [Colletotrichum higginsianum IMI 349063]OBR08721.1 hypothetical protein CH63R_07486 [Colletotrichum higginsianum IMI 349063]
MTSLASYLLPDAFMDTSISSEQLYCSPVWTRVIRLPPHLRLQMPKSKRPVRTLQGALALQPFLSSHSAACYRAVYGAPGAGGVVQGTKYFEPSAPWPREALAARTNCCTGAFNWMIRESAREEENERRNFDSFRGWWSVYFPFFFCFLVSVLFLFYFILIHILILFFPPLFSF